MPETPASAAAPATPAAETKVPSLAERQAARRATLAKAPANDSAAPSAPAASTPATPATAGGKPPAGSESDEDAALSALVNEDRRVKAEAKRIADERKKLDDDRKAWEDTRKSEETELAATRAAKAARAKGDTVGALRALGYTNEDLYESDGALFWQLAELQSKRPEATAEEAAAKLVDQKLAERDAAAKAEKERADAERKKTEDAAAEASAKEDQKARDDFHKSIVTTANAAIAKDASKYKAIRAHGGLNPAAVDRYVEDFYKASGNTAIPSEVEILDAFEAAFLEDAKKKAEALGLAPPAPTPKPPATVTKGWRQDPGQVGGEQPKTLAERKQARMAKLREDEATRRAAAR